MARQFKGGPLEHNTCQTLYLFCPNTPRVEGRVEDVQRVDQAPPLICSSFGPEPGQCWGQGGDDAFLIGYMMEFLTRLRSSVILIAGTDKPAARHAWIVIIVWERGCDRTSLKIGIGEKANHFMSMPHEFQLFNGLIIFLSFPSIEGREYEMKCVLG